MKMNKTGLVILVASTAISLMFCELALRAAGFVYQGMRNSKFDSEMVLAPSSRENDYFPERDYEHFRGDSQTSANILWAIGDSYTNAGNVDSSESYPAHLFRKLRREGFNYSVINLGQCEDPTWGVYERLKNALEKGSLGGNPAAVVVLVGSSDSFYYLLNGENSIKRETQMVVEMTPLSPSWVANLKLFKLFRHLKLALMNKQLGEEGEHISEAELIKIKEVYDEIAKKHKNGEITTSGWSEYTRMIQVLLDRHRALVDGSRGEFKLDDKIRLVFNTLAVPMMRYYSGRRDHAGSLEVMMKFANDFPEFFWDSNRCHPIALHIMSQTFRFQSRYTAADMKKFLVTSSAAVPQLRNGELYRLAEKVFDTHHGSEKQVEKVRAETWNKIVQLSKKFNFKLVVQTYAPNFTSANAFIAAVSKQYSLPLVDNHRIFKSIETQYRRNEIFADDSHFLPKGYEIMAENVLNVLKAQKIIQPAP